MNEDEMSLVAIKNDKNVITTLEQISKPLEDFVLLNGLPSKNVLVSNEEKAKLFNNFSSSIELLDLNTRSESNYLTKFVVASAVGLFDGALNYLWDEIVRTLRGKVVDYDLAYFYSIAEQTNSQYRNLDSAEDLVLISDYDLLVILKRINILSEYGFNTLQNINYMRNHASAAHPNINELTGLKLASILEDGIKYAINLEPDSSTIIVKNLFENIRTKVIPNEDFDNIGDELLKLPVDRLDDFCSSIFGLYCDKKKNEDVRKNVIEIAKRIWDKLSETTKYKIGAKYGYYRNNGFVDEKNLANSFLESVGGLKYKDNDSIVADLIDKLNKLKSVHFGINNFYNEYSYARDIYESLPNGLIPSVISNDLVKVICICYAGNGNGYKDGVDESAEIIYREIIDKFSNSEIKNFLLLFKDNEFVIDFNKILVKKRVKKLCLLLKEKTSNSDLLEALNIIIDCSDVKNVNLLGDYSRIINKIEKN